MTTKTIVLATALALMALAAAAPLAAAQDPVDPIGYKAAGVLNDKADICPYGYWSYNANTNTLSYRCISPPPP